MPKHKTSNLISLPAMKVKYRDIFDMRELYDTLYFMLIERGWGDKEEEGSEHWESYYYEKIGQDGSKENWIRWRTFKKSPSSPDYIGFYLDFDMHIIGLKSTEIVKDGRKIKIDKGEVEISLAPYIEEIYKEKFSQHSFLKHFKNIFSTRIYGQSLEQHKKELYQEAYYIQNSIKQWFKLKRHLPYEEGRAFYPSIAFPSHIKEE
ncbi:MAG TPA: hypothetical protein VJC39_05465 [Candidatus Nanoarchaeia archaeon]|nr:hypothetical protein [Candidatus Nanoarchaeia archaeon]